jgi:hypothetical protein
MSRFLPSPSLAISMTALVVALGGAGYSATGGNFILGKPNTASTTTGLIAPVNGKALLINNQSTGPNASGIGIAVAPGHAPFSINTGVLVRQLNSDKLDSLDSTEFTRTDDWTGPLLVFGVLVAGSNFFLAPAFTPDLTGRCEVIVSTQVNSDAQITETGPFYRAAIQRGVNPPEDDAVFGHYFPPIWGSSSDLYSPELTRATVFNVTAGEPTKFGAFLGDALASWAGKTAYVSVTYHCTTVGPLTATPALADKAGLAQTQAAR